MSNFADFSSLIQTGQNPFLELAEPAAASAQASSPSEPPAAAASAPSVPEPAAPPSQKLS